MRLCFLFLHGTFPHQADKAAQDVYKRQVESIPLIASSIMSKKLAAGADCILLDVKTGSGAFMKTVEDSRALAQSMVEIASHAGRRAAAFITDMDRPLGYAVGNALEVMESCETLKGRGPEDLTQLCTELAAGILVMAGKASDLEEGRALARGQLLNGQAFAKLCEMVAAQGGEVAALEDLSLIHIYIVYPAAGTASSAVRLSCEELFDASNAEKWVDVCKGWREEEHAG